MDRTPVAYEIVTPPASEPVSLAEATAQCRLDGTTDYNTDLTWLITVAREKVEADSERAFITQTRRMWIDQFPNAGRRPMRNMDPFPAQPWMFGGAMQAVEIGVKPVTAISSVQYVDQNGTLQTWSSANYLVDLVTYPARITPAYGLIWPICRVQMNAVQIQFVCGYSDVSLVPAMAKHAMRLLIGHWFENREAVGTVPGPVELAYWSLIQGISWH